MGRGKDSGVAWPKWQESLMVSFDVDTVRRSEMSKLLLNGLIPSLHLFWPELITSFIVSMGSGRIE